MTDPYEPPAKLQAEEAPDPIHPLLRDSAVWLRLAFAVVALAVFVFSVWPRAGQSYETNPLAGPLWGVLPPTGVEQTIAIALTVTLLPAMASGIVWPRWYTGLCSAIGCLAWFGLSFLAIYMSAM